MLDSNSIISLEISIVISTGCPMERDFFQILGRVNLDQQERPILVTRALGTQESFSNVFFFFLAAPKGLWDPSSLGLKPGIEDLGLKPGPRQ